MRRRAIDDQVRDAARERRRLARAGAGNDQQCVQVCPVACIPVNPAFVEDQETLWQKYRRLQLAVKKTSTP